MDLDPLDDIFTDATVKKNARAVGKFRPKSKFGPGKKNLAATSVSSSRAVQTIDTNEKELSEPVGTGKPSQHDDPVSILPEKDPIKDSRNDNVSLPLNLDVVSNVNGSRHVHMENSAGEKSDIFIGSETLGDFIPGTTNDTANTSNVAHVSTCPEVLVEPDYLIDREPSNYSTEGDVCIDKGEPEREELDIMDSINFSEPTTKFVQGTRKFQPKPKVKMQNEIHGASSISFPDSLGSQPVLPDTNSTVEDSVPAFLDDLIDLSSIGFSPGPIERISNLPSNEEFLNLLGMVDSGIHLEGVPEIPSKFPSRRAKTGKSKSHIASDPSLQQQKGSTCIQENETGVELRTQELINEAEDAVFASGEFSDQLPNSFAVVEDHSNIEPLQQESESSVKKLKRKSKKTDEDKEKPGKKQKKATEVSDQGAKAKPKKFSHSTRRRRVLDKALLATLEDEIDYHKVPLRDLILLAEHKERQKNKEEVAAPVVKESYISNDNSSLYHNEDEAYMSGEDNDGEVRPVVEERIINYHTGMKRTPNVRWSKQDTELFYEGVRQFGTDLSMIQHLFPDRTRQQVKLKYKKEERQYPLRLRDALTSRSKDHSYFERVIKRLKQISAENVADKDDESIDLTGGDGADETWEDANDEAAAKSEKIVEEEVKKNEHDVVAEEEAAKSSYDIEDDDSYLWSQYKSET